MFTLETWLKRLILFKNIGLYKVECRLHILLNRHILNILLWKNPNMENKRELNSLDIDIVHVSIIKHF